MPAAVRSVVVILSFLALSPAVAGQIDTPEIDEWLRIESGRPGISMWALVPAVPLPGLEWNPGMAVTCVRGSGPVLEASFGPYPRGRSVQFAVRNADGRVERYGPVAAFEPSYGNHEPRVEDRADVMRMLEVAARHGSLVSNGHFSFWNRASVEQNRQVLQFARTCP